MGGQDAFATKCRMKIDSGAMQHRALALFATSATDSNTRVTTAGR